MQSSLARQYQLIHSIDVAEIGPLPAIRSERAAIVARWFGLEDQINLERQLRVAHPPATSTASIDRSMLKELIPFPGEVTFITGPSGAGKSSLLRWLTTVDPTARFLDFATLSPPEVPLVDCFGQMELDQTLALLARVGLGEAWSYLRTPSELSEGQRRRMKLALALRESSCSATSPSIWLIDEFAALLDRITAMVVARCFRRAIRATGSVSAIVATSHEDVTEALAPDTIVTCDFRFVEVRRKKELIYKTGRSLPLAASRIRNFRSRGSASAKPPSAMKRASVTRKRRSRRSKPRGSFLRSDRSLASAPTDASATQ
jgi:ABC-type multidrug transport system ATPase subunit